MYLPPESRLARFWNSVTTRFLLIAIIFLVTAQLIFGANQIQIDRGRQIDNLERKAQSQADFVSSIAPEWVFFGDFLSLERVVQQATEDSEIVYVFIVHNDGRLLTRHLNRSDPIIESAVQNTAELTPENVIATLMAQDDVFEVNSPIISEGVQLGEVRLGYTSSVVDAQSTLSSRQTIIRSTLVSILLAALMILLLQWMVRQPLARVTDLAAQLAAGDLSARAEVSGQNEIDQLKRTFNAMAVQLQTTLVDLEEREAEARKLSYVASGTHNMVIISDAEGDIEWVNDAFERVTGFTEAEAIGKRPGNLLQGPLTNPETVEYMRNQLLNKQGFKSEIINYNKNREPYWVELDVQPVYDENNILTNFIAIEADISERKQAEERLRTYALELERSNRELQDFAYVASHDLQEPLRKIQAFGSRVVSKYGDVLDDRGVDYVNRMQNAASRMQNLIQALLEFSRVSTKAQPYKKVDLNEVVKHVVGDLEIRIEETGARVNVSQLPTIEADPVQMHQLFQNLIGNALKFIDKERTPVINVSAEDLPTHIAIENAKICVQDNGIGFDQKYSDRVFNVFQRLHGREQYQGTGVGLAICRKITDRHSGSIEVESQVNVGTKFTITLPQSQPDMENNYDFIH